MEKSTDKKGIILWDIDGTLIKIRSSKSDKHLLAINTILGTKFRGLNNSEGKTDLQIIRGICDKNFQNLGRAKLDEIIELLDNLTLKETQKLPLELNPNIYEALLHVDKLGFINGILTGNTPNRAKYKLESCGIRQLFYSKYSFYGDNAMDRSSLVKYCLSTLKKVQFNNIIIVGDTVLDIKAASEFNIPMIAVATGNQTYEDLKNYKPSLILENLDSAFKPFLDYISKFE